MQLLGEESAENDQIIDQLEQSDLRSGFYEGGFKTWECSLDLASLLLDRGPRKDIDELVRCDQIVEVCLLSLDHEAPGIVLITLQLGAGTAIPSLVLFRHALLNALSLTFVLQDYNDAVLRLVTLPNLLLTWAANTENGNFPTPSLDESSHGDLEISESLLQRFAADMKSRSINLIFLSGSWCPQLAALIPPSAPELGMVVLAAETIYSPESTRAFVELLVQLLQRVKMGKAMIGAKRVYFGVGGSIDGLKEACRERGAVAYEIENHGVPGMDGGVRRALVEVQMY